MMAAHSAAMLVGDLAAGKVEKWVGAMAALKVDNLDER